MKSQEAIAESSLSQFPPDGDQLEPRNGHNPATPQRQREYAKARKARKEAQRVRAETLPPKPKRCATLEDLCRYRGALIEFGPGSSVVGVDLSKLEGAEFEAVFAALSRGRSLGGAK